MISSKKGKLYLKFIIAAAIIAVAILAAAFYSYSALAAVPTATPAIVNTNTTTINGAFIANASIARASDQLFGYANFSSENASAQEENSMSEIRDFRASSEAKASETFKWFKRTLYQPQNTTMAVESGVGL